MADKKNILLVTNYFGFLHIVPLGNKDFYQSHNEKNPDKQYSWKVMDEAEATEFINKNKGFDPNFKTPKQAVQQLADRDAELDKLRAALADKDNETKKLQELLSKAGTAPTEPDASKAAVPAPNKPKPNNQ